MSENLAVIVLAAGKGTRMYSSRSKVLHTVGGASMLGHVLMTAKSLNPDCVVVVHSENAEPVKQEALRFAPDCKFALQKQQLGTANAVLAAKDALSGFMGKVLVLYGDTPLVRASSLRRLLTFLNNEGVAVIGMRVSFANEYGRLVLDQAGKLSRIVEFKEAPPELRNATLCNSGIFASPASTFFDLASKVKNNNSKGEFYLTDIVELAYKGGLSTNFTEEQVGELVGINNRQELSQAEITWQNRKRAEVMLGGVTLNNPQSVFFSYDTVLGRDVVIEPNVVFGRNVVVGDDVLIRAFCHIDGGSEGLRIGNRAIVGPYARLRPGADLAEDVHIGNFVEVKKSTIGKGSKANHLTYIGDALVGEGVNIGAGTITCNYDGVNKHITEIGDGSFIGSNTSLVAPIKLGKGVLVGAGSTLTEDVPEGSLALTRPSTVVKSRKK
jgi:bifunctional UDP-N-acetylglucosamine pyrophosphorylase/glucosamine-1-phosphate N-acetyltransferase